MISEPMDETLSGRQDNTKKTRSVNIPPLNSQIVLGIYAKGSTCSMTSSVIDIEERIERQQTFEIRRQQTLEMNEMNEIERQQTKKVKRQTLHAAET